MGTTRPICEGLFALGDAGPALLAGRCVACRERHFPAAEVCPYCGAAATIERIGPRGTLRLFTAVHTAPPGYRGPLPYGFGVVEVDDTGLQILSRLDDADPARLRPGLPLRLRIAPLFTDDAGCTVLTWSFAPEDH